MATRYTHRRPQAFLLTLSILYRLGLGWIEEMDEDLSLLVSCSLILPLFCPGHFRTLDSTNEPTTSNCIVETANPEPNHLSVASQSIRILTARHHTIGIIIIPSPHFLPLCTIITNTLRPGRGSYRKQRVLPTVTTTILNDGGWRRYRERGSLSEDRKLNAARSGHTVLGPMKDTKLMDVGNLR